MPPLSEAIATEYRPALSWTEGYRGLFAALRTDAVRLNFRMPLKILTRRCGPEHRHPFRFAGFAAFRLVTELFIVKKQLFARGEDEVCAAVNTLQHPVLEFHCQSSFGPVHRANAGDRSLAMP